MQKLVLSIIAAIGMMIFSGCGNLSPRQDQRIDNQDGKIGEIETNQNSIKNEMLNLKSQSEIQNSRLDRIQQGLANFQSNYENSGVQIFSGPGGLLLGVVTITALAVMTIHYRAAAKKQEKTANILAQSLIERDDPSLEDTVFRAAMNTDVEVEILQIMNKHQGIRRGLKLMSHSHRAC